MYCVAGVARAAGLGLGCSLASPTTEIFPFVWERSSFVKTFLAFLASVVAVASCGFEPGEGALGAVVCAEAGMAKKSARASRESKRSMKPPVLESRGRIFPANSVRGNRSAACGPRVRLVQVGTAEFFANDLEGFFGRADVPVVRIKRAFVKGKSRKQLAAVKVVLRESRLPHPGLNFVPFLHEVAALVDFPEEQAKGNVLRDF